METQQYFGDQGANPGGKMHPLRPPGTALLQEEQVQVSL